VIVVSDNSVLSCLAEIGQIELLKRLYGAITITRSVHAEGSHPSAPEALRQLLARPPEWISIVADPSNLLAETELLDAGEASAITLVWQHRETGLLIMDEKRGRKVAHALGLRLTGTAGLLTDAASEGLIDFDQAFDQLSKTGFHLRPELVEALRKELARRASLE